MSSTSRIPGFYRLSTADRRNKLADVCEVDVGELAAFDTGALPIETADGMIENVVGTYALPLGMGLNFLIDGQDYVVPMAVEEPSVVAAASNAAKMVRDGGGFHTEVSRPLMIGQVQITDLADTDVAQSALMEHKEELLTRGRELVPRLCSRGGGLINLEVRVLAGDMLVVHLVVDCRDAMGANLVNSLAEGLSEGLAELAGGQVGLRILSNLADQRLVTVTARVPDRALALPDGAAGDSVRQAIVQASLFAELDPYRASTHNKGIMNGIDAVLVATGNDWRGVEAGAHAYAAQSGRYRPLSTWSDEDGVLVGRLRMPMAVGTVGGALRVHPGARLCLDLVGTDSASELAAVVASVGLASNLSALRALATDGIQRGHMMLHARIVARAAGATGELIEQVASEISALGDVKPDRAKQVLDRLRQQNRSSLNPEEFL